MSNERHMKSFENDGNINSGMIFLNLEFG